MSIDRLKLIKYEKFFNLLPDFLFEIPHKKWIIPKINNIELLFVLHHFFLQPNLSNSFNSEKESNNHIFNNMLHIIDSSPNNISLIKKSFNKYSKNINTYEESYLTFDYIENPDIIILETSYSWESYIKKAIHSLNDFGHLLAIIPNIWLNKKHSMFLFLIQFNITHLCIVDDTKCIFHLQKKPTDNYINILDNSINKFIMFPIKDNIPLKNQCFINKILHYTQKYNYIFIKPLYSNKKTKNIKLIINKKEYLILNINDDKLPFLNLYFNSKIVKYIFYSFKNNISSALTSIPNILHYNNEYYQKQSHYNNNIDNFLYKLFNISIINIDNINKFKLFRDISIEIS